MHHPSRIFRVILTSLTSVTIAINIATAQSFEEPPIRNSKNLLPANLLKGEHHTVEEHVESDGAMNIYTVQSRFGVFRIRGTYFLIKRISEIDALVYLEENFDSLSVTGSAVGKVATDMVMGPIRATKRLYSTVSDTEKLKKTVSSAPQGVVNLFGAAANIVGSVAQGVYDAGKSVVGSGDKSGESGGGITSAELLAMAETQTLKYVGYTEARLELSRELSIDPYTNNQVLLSELRRVASISSAVKVASKFTPAVYSIPGVGSANKYLGYAGRAATYQDPGEVDKLSKSILDSVNTSGSEREKLQLATKVIFANENYSPPMRNEIIEYIKQLEHVEKISELLAAISDAQSPETAQFYLFSVKYLAEIHKKETPLLSILPHPELVAAISKKNELIAPLPIDGLYWTNKVGGAFTQMRKSITQFPTIRSIRIISGGTLSEKCRLQAMSLGKVSIEQYLFQ
jgi:hypothetical protein